MNKTSSRTGLFLMELIIGILFFSLAGALCIQMFVKSHTISQSSTQLNHGVLWAQNIAEAFQGCNGNVVEMAELFDTCIYDIEDGECEVFYLLFDQDFQPVTPSSEVLSGLSDTDFSYALSAFVTREADLLVCRITVGDFYLTANEVPADGNVIYQLEASLFAETEAAYES